MRSFPTASTLRVEDGPGGHRLALPEPSGFVWDREGPGAEPGRHARTAQVRVVIGRHGSYAMSPARMPVKGTMIIDSPLATTGQGRGPLPPAPPPAPPRP